MEYQDLDRMLNMRAIVEYSGSMPVIQFSRRMDFRFQSGMHFSDHDLEFSYFIPAKMAENRDLSILLAQTGAVRYGDLYFMNNTVSNSALYDAFDGLRGRCQSFVIDSLLIDHGKYLLSIRFNDRNLSEFSNAVMHFATEVSGLSLQYLGKSPGLKTVMNEVSQAGALTKLGLSVRPPGGRLDSEPFRYLGDEWVAEIRYMTKGVPISVLFKTENPVVEPDKHGFCTISEEENLYEYLLVDSNSFSSKLHSILYESRIVRFGRLMHYKNGILNLQNTIPRIQVNEMLQILNKFESYFPDWNLSINSIEGCTNCD